MPTFRAAALAAVLTLLALPAAARAAVVDYVPATQTLTYTAAAGEANQLQISRTADRLAFQEPGGVPITEALAGCQSDTPALVSCSLTTPPATGVVVALGDLDDLLIVGALGTIAVDADGMAGADRLDASAATASVLLGGGAGSDRLLAGLGASDLLGGADADTLIGGAAGATTRFLMGAAPDGPDDVQGGAGLDVADYEARVQPLRLTADAVADDGEAGEADGIGPAVEAIRGGAAADVIAGSALLDAELTGAGGSDQVSGGAGDDVLFGGEGNDTLTGNAGDDVAAPVGAGGATADAGADTFAGGPGFDTMSYASRVASVGATLDGQPNDGEAGEGDNVGPDVEELLGGRGADTFTGSESSQRIVGGGGADTIDPGAGVDDVRAGDGNDTISAQDATGDVIACGLGTDTVSADFDELLDACENVTLGPPPLPPDTGKPKVTIGGLPSRPRYHHVRRGLRPRIGANETASFVVELLGDATVAYISARRPYNLRLAKRRIARTAEARRVTLRPKAALLGPRRTLRVRIRVTATDVAGNRKVATKTLLARR